MRGRLVIAVRHFHFDPHLLSEWCSAANWRYVPTDWSVAAKPSQIKKTHRYRALLAGFAILFEPIFADEPARLHAQVGARLAGIFGAV